MQNDPFALSWPVQPDQILSDEPEPEGGARGGREEERAPQVRLPSQPFVAADQWLTTATPQLRRRTWMDDEDDEAMLPFLGDAAAAAEAEPAAVAASAAPSPAATQGQRRRRKLAMSWTSLCIALSLLLFIGYLSTIYLRSNVQQPGSGIANGVDLHPTPVLSPLAQRSTPVPTATPKPTPTTPAGAGQKKSDPRATPAPGTHPAAPTPTASGTKGPPVQATATPVIVPTPVPTTSPTGGPTPVPQPTATTAPFPTATTMPPTPTPIPQPTATTVASAGSLAFTDQSEQVASPATWTGCPGGCSFGTQPVNTSTHESQWFGVSGVVAQTELSGTIDISIMCSIFPQQCLADITIGNVSGGGISCPIDDTFSGGDADGSDPCTAYVSSPTYLAPGAISGSVSKVGSKGVLTVSWTSSAFYGNGGARYETQNDCNNALNVVASAGWSWLSSTWSGVANGNIVAQNPSEAVNGWLCYPGVGTITNSFQASVNASMSNGLVYNPAGPSNAAAAGLRAQFPAGWNDTYNSAGCYPSTVSVSGTTVVASCQDSALLTYAWTAGDMAGLAQAVAGQGIGAAEATCNGSAHVAGNCVATSNGHDMPVNAGSITVSPQAPGNPFGSADIGGGGGVLSADTTAWINLLPLTSVALLCVGCTGEFRRRRRKAVN